jgi:hypothetical protein
MAVVGSKIAQSVGSQVGFRAMCLLGQHQPMETGNLRVENPKLTRVCVYVCMCVFDGMVAMVLTSNDVNFARDSLITPSSWEGQRHQMLGGAMSLPTDTHCAGPGRKGESRA